jgi:phosphatidyl-myo-inositol dimannoside synthase
MKALLLSEIFPPKTGGSGRWFWDIYSRLPRETYVMAVGADPDAAPFDATHALNCLRWPMALPAWGVSSWKGICGYGALFRRIRNVIEEEGITVIHCGRSLPEGLLGWAASKWLGIPYLCYVHGEELATYQCSKEYRILSNLVFTGARRIIVNSRNTRDFLLKTTRASPRAIRLMHPGVDCTYFSPGVPDDRTRSVPGWQGRTVILTVGRLQKRKGHDFMIQAMPRIVEQMPNVLYAIAGSGEELEYLESLVAEAGLHRHVQFLGKVDDELLLACYRHCDLFVLPNRDVAGDFEGFGMVLVEAQACGKPVVAGNSGGTAETMIAGETGVVIDTTSPEKIASSLIEILGDASRLTMMGQRAATWVREQFDWRTLSEQAQEIFAGFESE